MEQWKEVDEVLDFAIGNEEEAERFYLELAGNVEKAWMKAVFEEFAAEERGHKAKLESVKSGKKVLTAKAKIMDLKIGDYLVDIKPEPKMDYQSALILAMKREKAAFRLYSDLANSVDSDEMRSLFLGLAQEEAKHKLRFEVEYDDNILTEN